MSSREHQQAEELAARAGEFATTGRRAEALRLYEQAARLEQDALERLPSDKVRTRAILGVSLAALQYKAGLFVQTETTVQTLLAQPDLLSEAREQLQAILQAARQGRALNGQGIPHLPEANPQPSETNAP